MRLAFITSLMLTAVVWAKPGGKLIYEQHCASCHGKNGEGVADEYDEALVGTKSIASLARLIHKTMPEDDEDAVVDEDAESVAQYIYHAFYSPAAQAKLKPVRHALLRRSQHQHRYAIADLVASFRDKAPVPQQQGLSAQYFNAEKMNKKKKLLLQRIDPTPSFDLASEHGVQDLNARAFSIYWRGSLLPKETGTYQFRVSTPNGARVFLNTYDGKKTAFIDAWVSSGNKMQQGEAHAFLLGGYAVPLMIEFISFKEKKSSILIEWKPPHGVWEKIPARFLTPTNARQLTIVSTPFPADDASLGYERGSTVSKAWNEAAANAAIEASVSILKDINKLARTEAHASDRKSKIRRFCEQFTERAYGRPLESSQIKRIHALFEKYPIEGAAQRSIMLALTAPQFLYPNLDISLHRKQDSWAVARHLALVLWDSVPDEALRTAAAQGQLVHSQQIRHHANRMLADPRAHHKIHRFFHEWLNLSEKEDLRKDPKLFPGFDQRLIADLRSSFNLFTNDIVWSEASDYRRLFLAQEIPMNPRLAAFYQTSYPAEKDVNHFAQLITPDRRRAGLLTHPFVLSAFSYHQQTSPIHRGVYLSRNVLGRFLKPPPKATEFKDSDFKPNQTMREKVTELTKDHSCMACHEIINPIGFSLENYDAVGRFRTREKNKPINTESDYITQGDQKIRIKGPQDLARLAVEAPGAHRAFIKHLFHHLVQQPTAAYGYNTMDRLHHSFKQGNFHIRKLMIEIATHTAPIQHQPKKP